MAMALAGDLDIPAVFISGDQMIIAEVKEKNPLIETAVVGCLFQPPAGDFDRRTFFLTIPTDVPKIGQYSGQLKRRFK